MATLNTLNDRITAVESEGRERTEAFHGAS